MPSVAAFLKDATRNVVYLSCIIFFFESYDCEPGL